MGKINAHDFGGTIKNAEQAQKLITKINDRLVTLGTKRKLKFTLGQAGDDPESFSNYKTLSNQILNTE